MFVEYFNCFLRKYKLILEHVMGNMQQLDRTMWHCLSGVMINKSEGLQNI